MEQQQLIDLVRRLCLAPAVSGWEDNAFAVAKEALEGYGETRRTPLGSLVCTVQEGDPGAPHLMIEAHLDQIGLIVTGVEEGGFLRVAAVGGVELRQLPSQPVWVFSRDGGRHFGVVASVPPHLSDGKEKPLKIEEVLVDTGYGTDEAKRIFAPGDMILLEGRFAALGDGYLSGAALDNRLGCAAVIAAAQEIARRQVRCRVTVVLATQEETGCAGAATAAFSVAPDFAIVVDVGFGSGYGVPEHRCGKTGGGPMIGYAPSLDRALTDRVRKAAEQAGIVCQTEAMGGKTGTDADGIVTAGAGVACALVSIPLRSMHTVVETAAVKDIADCAALLVEAAAALD